MSAQRAYLSLVARDRTSQAAEELERHLRQIQKELHEAEPKPKPEASDQKELKSDLEYRKAYAPFLKEFLSAASKEIGIARRGTDRIAHSLAAFRGTTSGTSDK